MTPVMNNQQAFDLALEGIRKQGYQRSTVRISKDKQEVCRYRGEGFLKCAIGHLIPDNMYNTSMEGLRIHYFLFKDSKLTAHFANVSADLLTELQTAHDFALKRSKENFEEYMEKVALKFSLKYSSKMTNQDAFEKALFGIRSQGYKRSLDFTGACMYRGCGGLKCAVGWLIPDDQYNASIEGLSVDSESVSCTPALKSVSMALLFDMQGAHDVWLKRSVEKFEQKNARDC